MKIETPGIKMILSVVGLALVLSGIFHLRARTIATRSDVAPSVQAPWALQVVKTRKGVITEGFPVLATLSAQDEISIKPRIGGVITAIGPRVGKSVRKGDLLAAIDTIELSNDLGALKASLASAKASEVLQKSELRRIHKLIRKGYAAPEMQDKQLADLKGAQGRVEQLRAQIAAANTRIAYGAILSPVNGAIIARHQTKGDIATPGKEIYRLNADSGAKVTVTVPQEVLADLKPGSPIILSYAGKTKSVELTRISPSLDALSMGVAQADIDAIPFHLPSGTKVPARVTTNSYRDVMIAPLSAVAIDADNRHAVVFQVSATKVGEGYRLSKRKVRLLSRGPEGVAISGDLRPGDMIVNAHQSVLLRLRDGEPVRPTLLHANSSNVEGTE